MDHSSPGRKSPPAPFYVKVFNVNTQSLQKCRRPVRKHNKNPFLLSSPPASVLPAPKEVSSLQDFIRFSSKAKCRTSKLQQQSLVSSNLEGQNIIRIGAWLQNLINLRVVNAEQNQLNLEDLSSAPVIEYLDLSANRISQVSPAAHYPSLKELVLSQNKIDTASIAKLAELPSLQKLSLACNLLKQIPPLSQFKKLKELNISHNQLSSNYRPAELWQNLALSPVLQVLLLGSNTLRGIHTQRLREGNFSKLRKLDFSDNAVDLPQNLICARNFPRLEALLVTGNPFARDQSAVARIRLQIQRYTKGTVINQTRPDNAFRTRTSDDKLTDFRPFHKLKDSFSAANERYLFGLKLPQSQYLGRQQLEQRSYRLSNKQEQLFLTQHAGKKDQSLAQELKGLLRSLGGGERRRDKSRAIEELYRKLSKKARMVPNNIKFINDYL